MLRSAACSTGTSCLPAMCHLCVPTCITLNPADQQSCGHQDVLRFDSFPIPAALAAALLRPALHSRPNEGSLRFNVEFSPMASPNFEPGRPTENANELARLIERGLRETKAVDLEALCVLAGRKVECMSA